MKGNIMDKKILLGGAAALLLAGSMYATPASANIELSIGGEAQMIATSTDTCFTAGANTTRELLLTPLTSYAGTTDAALNTFINGLGLGHNAAVFTADTAGKSDTAVTFDTDPCGGLDPDNPVLSFKKEITIGASGTLANGLEVSFDDKIDLTDVAGEQGAFELALGGAFGTLKFKDGAPGAVDAVLINKFDIDGAGNQDAGKFSTETAGTDGTGILYSAPSMGALDLHISYAPNSADSGYDNAAYTDTMGLGMTYTGSGVTVAAGMESADANAAGACTVIAAGGADALTASHAMVKALLGGNVCGDQTLTYVGAEFTVADMTLNAGYQVLDTDEADVTKMGIGIDTTVGDYDMNVSYRTGEVAYAVESLEDTTDIIGVELKTALGDGVDFAINVSSNKNSRASEGVVTGKGSQSNVYAAATLTVGF
jgi:hypothetical protein